MGKSQGKEGTPFVRGILFIRASDCRFVILFIDPVGFCVIYEFGCIKFIVSVHSLMDLVVIDCTEVGFQGSFSEIAYFAQNEQLNINS